MRIERKKLVVAFLFGAGSGFVHNTIPGDGTAVVQILVFYLALFPLAVLAISCPLNVYRQSITTATVAILGWTMVKLGTYTTEMMWIFWGVYAGSGLIANLAIVSIATFLRRKYYPVYPSGHCQQCGYDLMGNESGVCPECGTEI